MVFIFPQVLYPLTVASLGELHRFRLKSGGISFAEMQAKESQPGRRYLQNLLFTADLTGYNFSKLCFSAAFTLPTKDALPIPYFYITVHKQSLA